MNCISSLPIRSSRLASYPARLALKTTCLAILLFAWHGIAAAMPEVAEEPLRVYDLRYTVSPDPATASVQVTARLNQPQSLLRELRMRIDPRISDMVGDGVVEVDGEQATWIPPETGGTLSWRVDVRHRRNGSGYDAWLEDDWGIFRAEDVIPRAATRALIGAESKTVLRFRLPRGWSAVTQYAGGDDGFLISQPGRRFDQPSGWILVGRIGVRRETIGDLRIAVAGPLGQSVRRMDILAMLRWTIPELERLLPKLPDRLTVISAGDPMWRGGLSAPESIFLHVERPLISENATSTLLHEVMHMALGIRSRRNYDWIVEGLAEYYSLELLRRSGTISERRYELALEDQANWASDASALCQSVSSGAGTALAVTVLASLDTEIREKTDGKRSLDDVVQRLVARTNPVGLLDLAATADELIGAKSDVLRSHRLVGCASIPGEPRTD